MLFSRKILDDKFELRQEQTLLKNYSDLLKNDFPAKFLPVDFGGEVPNDNSVKITKLIKKAAPKIEKEYAYLKAGNKINFRKQNDH